jgi:hypothetical protein
MLPFTTTNYNVNVNVLVFHSGDGSAYGGRRAACCSGISGSIKRGQAPFKREPAKMAAPKRSGDSTKLEEGERTPVVPEDRNSLLSSRCNPRSGSEPWGSFVRNRPPLSTPLCQQH